MKLALLTTGKSLGLVVELLGQVDSFCKVIDNFVIDAVETFEDAEDANVFFDCEFGPSRVSTNKMVFELAWLTTRRCAAARNQVRQWDQ